MTDKSLYPALNLLSDRERSASHASDASQHMRRVKLLTQRDKPAAERRRRRARQRNAKQRNSRYRSWGVA